MERNELNTYQLPEKSDISMVTEPIPKHSFGYKESDIPCESLVLNINVPENLRYNRKRIITLISNYAQGEILREQQLYRRFTALLAKWRHETEMLSSPVQIVRNDAFREMVSMGNEVVPFILDDIEKHPSNLVWALNEIFHRRISDVPHTTITESCKLWIKELNKK